MKKDIFENIEGLIKTEKELLKMELEEHIADATAKVIYLLMILVFSFLLLSFVSLGLANYINHVKESGYIGFLWLGAIYLVMILLLFIANQKMNLVKSMRAYIIKNLDRKKRN